MAIKYEGVNGRIIDKVDAIYSEQELWEYNNNPLIEALPDIFDEDDLISYFSSFPTVDPHDLLKRPAARFQMIQRVKHYSIPWGVHKDLERNISSMIRRGYIARNPLDNQDFQKRLFLISQQEEEEVDKTFSLYSLKDLQSSALTLSLIGISGVGKTTAINKIFKMYPQVIKHKEYSGASLVKDQIVWIKLECPFDGSLKTFCQSFFEEIDKILGTRYYEKYGNARNSRGKMMIDMERVATIHSIGIIAIDEMQHLIKAKTAPEELLNFLVTLENRIGVPLALIGTFKALEVLTKELRMARRATSQKSIIWDRMDQGQEWDLFLRLMWKLQWLKEPTPYSENLANIMYEESQGITSIAVSLFALSQVRALDAGDEIVTEKIIRETAKKDLFMVRNIIKALKNNDREKLIKYEDVVIDLDEILKEKGETVFLQKKLREYADGIAQLKKVESRTKVEILATDISSLDMLPNLSFKDIEEVATNVVNKMGINEDEGKLKRETLKIALDLNEQKAVKKQKNDQITKNKVDKEGMVYLYKKAVSDKKHIYDLLDETGFIKKSKEFPSFKC